MTEEEGRRKKGGKRGEKEGLGFLGDFSFSSRKKSGTFVL